MHGNSASRRQPIPLSVWWILGLSVAVSALTPILTLDTDLWYHLRHGRVILDSGELPSDTSFSFLRPIRDFVDYYWLFQVVVQAVFQATGYGGLVALRTLVIFALLFGIGRLLSGGNTPGGRAASGPESALALALIALAILPRALSLRPHDFTYAFLVWTLVALMRGRTPFWLPLLAVAWVNFHGVTYPVLLVVLGAFAVDLAWAVARGRNTLEDPKRRALWLGSSALAVLLTPHGLRLLPVPFHFTGEASRVIRELAPPQATDLLRWNLDLLHPNGGTLAILLLWLLPWLLWRAHRSGGVAASRWILLAAGLYLFQRAARFQVEFVLLAVPLVADALRAAPRRGSERSRTRVHPVAVAALAGACLSLASMAWSGSRQPYPMADRGELPRGVVSFLAEHGGGGRILHLATFGGYLLGQLDDSYRIAIDLELPFAFAVEDYDHVIHAFNDDLVLSLFLDTYEPEFIAVSASQAGVPDRLQRVAPEYQPVFVDDALALWAHAGSLPQLVDRWRLRAVDPHRLLADSSYMPAQADAAAVELGRVVRQAPRTRNALRLLVRIYLAQRRYPAALERAEALAALEGPQALDLQLLADARAVTGREVGAIEALEQALDIVANGPGGDEAAPLHRRLAYLHVRLGHPKPAYEHLRRVVGVHRPGSPEADMRRLERLAREVGEVRHAEQIRQALSWRSRRP